MTWCDLRYSFVFPARASLPLQLRRAWSSYDTQQPYRHAMTNADEAMQDPW